MIIIPALAALVQPVLHGMAIGALVGGLLGGGTAGVVEGVKGVQEHGEINQTVVVNAGESALHGAADGALFGGLFGGIGGAIFQPVNAAVNSVVSIGGNIGSVVRGAATGAIVGGVGNAGATGIIEGARAAQQAGEGNRDVLEHVLSSAASAAATGAFFGGLFGGIGRSILLAQQFKTVPKAAPPAGYVYTIADDATGLTKIGRTIHPQQRLAQLQRTSTSGGSLSFFGLQYTDDAVALERTLHQRFAGSRVTGEWFDLNGLQRLFVLGI